MNYAIIAAGEGSRLVNEGIETPKPLVTINGEPMIDRLIRIFVANGANKIAIIVNEEMEQVYSHLTTLITKVPITIVRKTTPSSMHSFAHLAEIVGDEKFCLTTVDTIFREEDFAAFVSAFEQSKRDGMMAVTSYIEDEKPLYVDTKENMRITAFLDNPYEGAKYISGGIYGLNAKSLPILNACISSGVSRMRNFQRALVEADLNLEAYPLGKIIDVDHANDIGTAELFLNRSVLAISRAECFSPNNVDKDTAILTDVSKRLHERGWDVFHISEEDFAKKTSPYYKRVIGMLRSKEAIAKLKEMESRGCTAINSASAIGRTDRGYMLQALQEAGVQQPSYILVDTALSRGELQSLIEAQGLYPCWIKRADAQTIAASDVTYAENCEQVLSVLSDYVQRNIAHAAISKHLEGDLLKFYAVTGTDFFHYLYPTAEGHSKFGLEVINGDVNRYSFDLQALKDICQIAAETLELDVYGGDAIVSESGEINIIDLNDWPSFAPCRKDAAKAIAARANNKFETL